MKSYVQEKLDKYIVDHSGEWLYKTGGKLGRSIDNGKTIQTNVSGIVWVRTSNGQETTAYNNIAPYIWDTNILLGVSKDLPGVFQVIEVRENYSVPAAPFVVNHAPQHYIIGTDPIFPDKKQILSMTILVSDSVNFKVRVFGGIARTASGWTIVKHTGVVGNPDIDLSSYIPSSGALYVSIEFDNSGTLIPNVGSAVSAKELLTISDIPSPAINKYMIGYILLYETMPYLLNTDIMVPAQVVTDYIGLSTGEQVNAAEAGSPLNNDKFPFYKVGDGTLRYILYEDLLALIHDEPRQYRQFVYDVIGDNVDILTDAGDALYDLKDLE